MKSKIFRLAALAILSAAASLAWAQTPNFLVSASVSQYCSVTTAPLSFGPYDPVSANNSSGADLSVNTTVTVTCTKGAGAGTATDVTVGLSFSTNATGTQRAMKNTGNTDLLNYNLYLPTLNGTSGEYDTCPSPVTSGTIWGDTSNMLTPASAFWSGAAHPLTVCGFVPKGQAATGLSVGDYQDTVNVLITF